MNKNRMLAKALKLRARAWKAMLHAKNTNKFHYLVYEWDDLIEDIKKYE